MKTYRFAALVALVFALPLAASAQMLVVSSNGNNALEVFDALTGERVFQVGSLQPGPHEIALSPDGRTAYVAIPGGPPGTDKDGSISVLDLANRSLKDNWSLQGYKTPHDLRVSADGTKVWVVSAQERAVLELDAATGKVGREWKLERDGGWMIAAQPDGSKLWVAHLEGNALSVLERDSGAVRTLLLGEKLMALEVRPDGKEVWAGSLADGKLLVLDSSSEQVIARPDPGDKTTVRVRFTPDSSKAVVVNGDNKTVSVFDAASKALLGNISVPHDAKVLTVSADGKLAYVTHPEANAFSILDLSTRKLVKTVAAMQKPDGIAFSPLRVVPNTSEKVVQAGPADAVPEGIAWDPESKTYFVSSTWHRSVIAIDQKGRAREFSRSEDGLLGVVGMRVDPQRRKLWVASSDAGVNMPMRDLDPESEGRSLLSVYDLRSNRLEKTYRLDNKPEPHFLNDVVIGPRGEAYVSDSRQRSVYVAYPDKNELEKLLTVEGVRWVNGIDLSDDKRYLFVANDDGAVRVDLTDRSLVRLKPPAGRSFSPDGMYFYRGDLIGIEGGEFGGGVQRLLLSPSLDTVVGLESIDQTHPLHHQPTTGVLIGNELHYLANGQLQHFRRMYQVEKDKFDASRLTPPIIMKVKLDARFPAVGD